MCASVRKDRSDTKTRAKELLEGIPPQDLLIMATGAWLGYNGYTIVTGLLNTAKGVDAAGGPVKGPLGPLSLGPVGFIINEWIKGSQAQEEGVTAEEIHAKLLNAGVGLIEAYALTRPGTIGGILQGIGEIIPL